MATAWERMGITEAEWQALDIYAKLRSLNREEAAELAAHLNDCYTRGELPDDDNAEGLDLEGLGL